MTPNLTRIAPAPLTHRERLAYRAAIEVSALLDATARVEHGENPDVVAGALLDRARVLTSALLSLLGEDGVGGAELELLLRA